MNCLFWELIQTHPAPFSPVSHRYHYLLRCLLLLVSPSSLVRSASAFAPLHPLNRTAAGYLHRAQAKRKGASPRGQRIYSCPFFSIQFGLPYRPGSLAYSTSRLSLEVRSVRPRETLPMDPLALAD